MTDEREYIGRFEVRQDAEYSDVDNLVAQLERRGYQVEAHVSNGSFEVYRV